MLLSEQTCSILQSNMFHIAENLRRVETCSSGNNCWNMIFLPSSCPCRSKGPPCRPHHHPLGRFCILPRRHSLPCPLQQRDHTESLWKKAHRRPHQWQTEASTPWAIGPPLPRNGPPSRKPNTTFEAQERWNQDAHFFIWSKGNKRKNHHLKLEDRNKKELPNARDFSGYLPYVWLLKGSSFSCSTEQIEEHEKSEVKNDQEAKGAASWRRSLATKGLDIWGSERMVQRSKRWSRHPLFVVIIGVCLLLKHLMLWWHAWLLVHAENKAPAKFENKQNVAYWPMKAILFRWNSSNGLSTIAG